MEKQLIRKEIYDGKVIHVVKDDILTSDNKQAIREVVLHNGGACIALKDESDGKYFLVKQYRYCHEKEMLEFCAGKIEKDENPDLTIVREAKEELNLYDFSPIAIGTYVFESDRERELIYAYKTVYDKDILPDINELDGGRFWTMEEIKGNIGKGVFTPNFESEFNRFFL